MRLIVKKFFKKFLTYITAGLFSVVAISNPESSHNPKTAEEILDQSINLELYPEAAIAEQEGGLIILRKKNKEEKPKRYYFLRQVK